MPHCGVMRRIATAALALGLLAAVAAAGASPRLITHGSRTTRWIAFTFDADMTPAMIRDLRSGKVKSWYDRRLVRTLRRTHTPATIFLTGLWTKTYPGAVRSFARDRLFELDNHSWDHRAWAGSCYGLTPVRGRKAKRAEVKRTAK